MQIRCGKPYAYYGRPRVEPDPTLAPDLDNTREPLIRNGGEPFTSYYEIEDCYLVCHVIDPARSLAAPLVRFLSEARNREGLWPWCDVLHRLLYDLDFRALPTLQAKQHLFHTLFPRGTNAFLIAESQQSYAADTSGHPRVLNHPSFHTNPNCSEKRLVEIATELDASFALDRACLIPEPATLAREIALLCYGLEAPERVPEAQTRLTQSIADVFDEAAIGGKR